MKQLFPVAMMALLISFSSCGKKGMSDELKGKLHSFETDWKATGESLANFGTTMNSTFASMDDMMKDKNTMDHAGMAADKMAVMEELHNSCSNIEGKMEMVRTAYTSTMTGFTDDEAAYREWKTKVQKHEIKEGDAEAGINDFQVKLQAYKDNLDAWGNLVTELNDKCTENCKAMDALMQ
ncbi:MAG TPA: hypothetical protein P5512_09495 [Chitinophagales bacterium]|nr:hypothetical protein [Chitinophagales bacterium]HQU75671.1 hypothetical protein [Chitinophagales bacterium]HRX24361.1 hypothetical protein [Chitinophagales bacterium]